MSLAPLFRGIEHCQSATAIIDASGEYSYAQLGEARDEWVRRLSDAAVPAHAVVSVESDYTIGCVAALLALAERPAVIVPLSADSAPHRDEFLATAQVEWRVRPGHERPIERRECDSDHALYRELARRGSSGLVLFSSGSTGTSKAAVHDLEGLVAKFETPKRTYRTLVFLQPDHIGGFNTLCYTLSNGGAVIVPAERTPKAVLATIARYQVELLPTSPTFLNLLLLARGPEDDLRSVRLITYGTETMPEATLARVREAFPHVRLQQTYGLTEVGILRSRSRPGGSLWVKVGGEGYETKVQDGRLWIKASSAMLGYLNAPSPFSDDGYLDTGDLVEVDGEWIRIVGRESEIINVGGSKVFPAEVENVLLQMPNVVDAVVVGEPHALTGQIVVAHVQLADPEPDADFKVRLRQFCRDRLASYKTPARVTMAAHPLHGARFKKMRRRVTTV